MAEELRLENGLLCKLLSEIQQSKAEIVRNCAAGGVKRANHRPVDENHVLKAHVNMTK